MHYQSSSTCDPLLDTTGRSNIDSTPGFVDPANGDYHLLSTACSRHKGTNAPRQGTFPIEVDIDREDRINTSDGVGVIDQGADEYHP